MASNMKNDVADMGENRKNDKNQDVAEIRGKKDIFERKDYSKQKEGRKYYDRVFTWEVTSSLEKMLA